MGDKAKKLPQRWLLLQGEGEEEETDDLVSQVLDEIGVTLNADMVGVPGKEAQAAKQVRPLHRSGRGSYPTRCRLAGSQDIVCGACCSYVCVNAACCMQHAACSTFVLSRLGAVMLGYGSSLSSKGLSQAVICGCSWSDHAAWLLCACMRLCASHPEQGSLVHVVCRLVRCSAWLCWCSCVEAVGAVTRATCLLSSGH